MTVAPTDLLEGFVDDYDCAAQASPRTAKGRSRGRDARREPDAAQARLIALARTIEGEIVPRLLLARGTTATAAAPRGRKAAATGARREIGAADVDELVRLLLAHDSTVAAAYANSVHLRGASLESICMDLLAPAARRLGDLWSDDRADLIEVTLGLCRLQTLLRDFSHEHRDEVDLRVQGRSVLLVPAPGEQHTFGLQLLAELFRRARWDVWAAFPSSDAELLELVARERFALIGFTVGCESRLTGLAARIKAVRRASRNKAVGILVGGRVFSEHPEHAAAVGADATAADGPRAVQIASNLVEAIAQSP
jgi:methanogenic corrinoid protein MtbC1